MTTPALARLTKSDLAAIEYEVEQRLGKPPSVESLRQEGIRESVLLHWLLSAIRNLGRIITLLAAEIIQSAGALIIAVVFAVLEFNRVLHGAQALGQIEDQARLIAFAVVTANVVHPIYALRELRRQTERLIQRQTLRGYAQQLRHWMFGQPQQAQVEWAYNPALHIAAFVITWATIGLAIYDLVGPLLTALLLGQLDKPLLIMLVELLMGVGLSVAGVFFLQAAAHEIGVRILTDQPLRMTEVLDQRVAAYHAHADAVREEVRLRLMATKIAEQERKQSAVNPTLLGSMEAETLSR